MKLLLDTHTLLWFYGGDDQLPASVRETIRNPTNECLVSMASLWEIVIKISLGKLRIDATTDDLFTFLAQNQIWVMPIELTHLLELERLPQHYKDPFDRIIIAQATAERLPVATKDVIFSDYGIDIRW